MAAATDRFVKAGIADKEEVAETCCYATQDKIWSKDPQGLMWEWYVVLQDAETFSGEATTHDAGPALAPACCA